MTKFALSLLGAATVVALPAVAPAVALGVVAGFVAPKQRDTTPLGPLLLVVVPVVGVPLVAGAVTYELVSAARRG